jgi:hypothetical protein
MLQTKKIKMMTRMMTMTILLGFLTITGFSQNEKDRACDGGELLTASQIIPISERVTPLDDPNTDDIVKAKKEWDAWGKKEFYDQERSKDKVQVNCWTKLVKAGDKKLGGAFLKGANLSGAKLLKADLTGANLTEADLTNADLSEAILTNAAVSRKTTKGVNFADWKKRGGIIVD